MLTAAFHTTDDIEAFIHEFEACTLSKSRWTHHGHLVVALWYLTRHTPEETLDIVRRRIRAYNEATGTPNTDSEGYHETLTRLFLGGVAAHIAEHRSEPLPASLAAMLQSPLSNKDWPLRYYSRKRLFSVAARHHWLEPDHAPPALANDTDHPLGAARLL
jgi:hypothetical protein